MLSFGDFMNVKKTEDKIRLQNLFLSKWSYKFFKKIDECYQIIIKAFSRWNKAENARGNKSALVG